MVMERESPGWHEISWCISFPGFHSESDVFGSTNLDMNSPSWPMHGWFMIIYLSKMVIFHSCHSYVCYVKRPEGDSTLFAKRPKLQLLQVRDSPSVQPAQNPPQIHGWVWSSAGLAGLAAWISWMLPWCLGQAGLTSRQRSSNKWLDFQIKHLKYLKSQFSKTVGTNGDFPKLAPEVPKIAALPWNSNSTQDPAAGGKLSVHRGWFQSEAPRGPLRRARDSTFWWR